MYYVRTLPVIDVDNVAGPTIHILRLSSVHRVAFAIPVHSILMIIRATLNMYAFNGLLYRDDLC